MASTLTFGSFTTPKYLSSIVSWTQLEYDYSTSNIRNKSIKSGEFIPGKAIPNDVDAYFSKDRESQSQLFITIPRYRDGIPASLGTVRAKKYNDNPIIAPYPSWKLHSNPQACRHGHIISAIRIQVDANDQLWVLDDGRVDGDTICQPKILCFCLKTKKLLKIFQIPYEQIKSNSLLGNFIIDNDNFAYIADTYGLALIVCNLLENNCWRIEHKSFEQDYDFLNFLQIDFEDDGANGILGLALSRTNSFNLLPKLYYYSSPTNKEHAIETDYLKNKKYLINDTLPDHLIVAYPEIQKQLLIVAAMTSNNAMIYGSAGDFLLMCRNIHAPFKLDHFDTLIIDNTFPSHFVSSLKVINNPINGEELLILSRNGTNIEIQIANIEYLLRETNC